MRGYGAIVRSMDGRESQFWLRVDSSFILEFFFSDTFIASCSATRRSYGFLRWLSLVGRFQMPHCAHFWYPYFTHPCLIDFAFRNISGVHKCGPYEVAHFDKCNRCHIYNLFLHYISAVDDWDLVCSLPKKQPKVLGELKKTRMPMRCRIRWMASSALGA